MSLATWVRRGDDPRAHAGSLIEALRKGETVWCTAYRRRHHRLDDRVDRILHAIHALVAAEVPAVQCGRLHYRGGERVWVWSLGEPTGVAYFPRQQPERLEVEFG
jgi:hypothetical protein